MFSAWSFGKQNNWRRFDEALRLTFSFCAGSPAVGPCSKTCGGGWRVVRDASDRTTLESCNSAACVVNVLSDWGAWSRCALHRAGGDSGVRYRYRDCPHQSTDRAFVHCAGEQIQFRDCDTAAGAGDGPVSSQPEPELLAEHAPRRGRLLDVDYIGAPRWSTGDAARRARSGGGVRGTSGRAVGAGPPAPAFVRRQVDIDCVLDCLRQDDCARITAACVTKRHAPAGHNDLRRFLQTYMNDKLNPAAGLGRLASTPGHDSDTALGHGRARRSIREVYENTSEYGCGGHGSQAYGIPSQRPRA